MTTLSQYLSGRYNYETGPFEDIPDETPAKRFLLRSDYNLNNQNKVNFRYNYLDSFTDVYMSSSASALGGRSGNSPTFLTFENTNYRILENIRSGIGEWNSVIGRSMANSLQTGYTSQDESRGYRGEFFPFVDIFNQGASYLSFGFEPFTVNNELRYNTFQIQNNLTKFTDKHSWTVGAYIEKYHSDNVFFGCCPQGAWSYNSLNDFYTDANDALANPNRTVSPVAARRFQIRWVNLPELEKPEQPLDVWYNAGYVQDEWRPRRNVTMTMGLRFDVSKFGDTAYRNASADALTFRDEDWQSSQIRHGKHARDQSPVVAARRIQLGRLQQCANAGSRRHRVCSAAVRRMCGYPTRLATPACSSASGLSTTRISSRSRPTSRSTEAPRQALARRATR